MDLLELSLSERRALGKYLHETKDIKVLKRTQAFLWLSDDMSVQEVAKRLGVSRRTIYYWVSLYRQRRKESVRSRLQDRQLPGRPPTKSAQILPELAAVLSTSPRRHGYRHATWTASLLCQRFKRDKNVDVSTKTMRRCLQQCLEAP
jgi:transposase